MKKPPTPLGEAERLAALARYGVLDTLPEAQYDDIARLAATVCGVPIASVSFVDAERQWYKSRIGIDFTEVERRHAFCDHVIGDDAALFLVPDARADGRFDGNPLVNGETRVRFYAAAPLETSDGFRIGTLCVADRSPHTLSAAQQEALLALARTVMRLLETRRTLDKLQATHEALRLFELVVAHTSEGVVIAEKVRDRLTVRYVNAAFTRMMAYPDVDVLGRDPRFMIADRTPPATVAAIQAAHDQRCALRIELDLERKDGSVFPAELALSPVLDDEVGAAEVWVAVHRDMSDRREAEKTAAIALKLSRLIEQMPAIMWIVDPEFRFTECVGAGLESIGFAPGEAVGLTLGSLSGTPFGGAESLEAHRNALRGIPSEYEHAAKGRWLRSYLEPACDAQGEIVGVIGIALDVTAYQHDRHALVVTQSNLMQAQQTAHLGSWEIDLRTGETLCSQELYRLYGLEASPGHTSPTPFRDRHHLADAAGLANAIGTAKRKREPYSIDHRIVLGDGSVRWLQERGEFRYDEHGEAIVSFGTSLDITERKTAEDGLKRLAHEDALTGLASRARFMERLDAALGRQEAGPEFEIAVLFIDVDHFKTVNETLGHLSGDVLLRGVAERLRDSTGPGDVIARAGGDEFIILTTGDQTHVQDLLNRTTDAFARPFVLETHEIFCTLSIGVTRAPHDGTDAEELLRNADTAMYAAKAAGRDTARFFTQDMQQRVARRLLLETDLRRAIERDEFVLHYQPTFDRELRMSGVEALIRWHHPNRGMVPPDHFISIAEETGLIVPIGAWVIRSAFGQLASWSQTYGTNLQMAVNISGRQLESADLIDTLNSAVAATGLPHSRFTLELTESVIMSNVETAIATIATFKALGFKISVDDFGTGYSSLASLKRLPIDTLKIDRSFIHDTPHDADDCAIVDAVIALGRSLNLTLLAEGVETADQLKHLLARDVDEYQGFLLARPAPATAISELLESAMTLQAR